MTFVINLPVTSIPELYDLVAKTAGKNPDKCKYDCTKIRCASNFADEIEEAYKIKFPTEYRMAFGMNWVCYGPKVDESLKNGVVEIEEGFFI